MRWPSWLITAIITLLLCRSIPAINLSLGLFMVLFVVANSGQQRFTVGRPLSQPPLMFISPIILILLKNLWATF
jgi:hypothetical protein